MGILLVTTVASFFLTMGLIRTGGVHAHLSCDHDISGPQKFHALPVPRIGGLGVLVALGLGVAALWWQNGHVGQQALWLLLCGLPAFGAGIAEDLTKRVTPARRLLAIAVSAGLAIQVLDAVILHTAIPGIDAIVATGLGAAIVTVFAVSGVANSINLIDGFNGLASLCVVLMLTGLALVGLAVGDALVVPLALAGAGSVLGFFVWNFPRGRVFLGDGGAYFLGFYVAELAVLLLHRNPGVSPVFPLLLVIYPVFETLFSMYRRRVLKGRPVGRPDGAHLHSLIFRRIVGCADTERGAQGQLRRNSMTAPYLWVLCGLSVLPAVLFWDSTPVLATCIVLFAWCYVSLYWRIVRWRTPRWLRRRR